MASAAAALAEWRAEGYARLGRMLDDAQLASLRARADEAMLTHDARFFYQHDSPTGRYEDLVTKRGFIGPSLRYRKLEKLERDPIFLQALAPFAGLAREALGPDIALCRMVLFTKAAQGGTELPWHQDGGSFWGLTKDPEFQLWIALDDTPADSGCVELIPRSHLRGLATKLGGVIPPELTKNARGIEVPARAGEALLLHNYVWHRSGTNRTAHPRRALSVCLMDAATRCTRKRRPREFPRVFSAPLR